MGLPVEVGHEGRIGINGSHDVLASALCVGEALQAQDGQGACRQLAALPSRDF